MKLLKFLLPGIFLLLTGAAHSQVSVNIQIGNPPAWGPTGYTDVQYYFIPDIGVYYDIRSARYIHMSGNKWIYSTNLPARHRHYNLNTAYIVVMNDYYGNAPYTYYKEHKIKYAKDKRGKNKVGVWHAGPGNNKAGKPGHVNDARNKGKFKNKDQSKTGNRGGKNNKNEKNKHK